MDIPWTIGAMEVGVVVAAFLTGTIVIQSWTYFTGCERDPLITKLLVAGVCLTEVVHTVFLVHSVYYYTIASFGNLPALSSMVWSIQSSLSFVGPIMFAIRTWYCIVRVYPLTKQWAIAAACWFLSFASFALVMAVNATIYRAPVWSTSSTPLFHGLVLALFCASAVADIAIAASICWKMRQLRWGINDGEDLIRLMDKLTGYTIGSGLLTAVGSLLQLVVYLTMKNFLFMALCFIIAKLISNSLLATLNSRNRRRTRSKEYHIALSRETGETLDKGAP